MPKDGSTKSKSAADHAAARKAAQLRKKRHKGGFHQANAVAPLSLIEIAAKQRKRQVHIARIQGFVDAKVTAAKHSLKRNGVVVIDRDDRDGKAVINALKDDFRGSDIRWHDDGNTVVFSKPKQPAKKPA